MTTKPTIIEEKEISMVELKEEIAHIKKRDEKLNFRGEKTEEYLNAFVTLKPKEAKEIFDKIGKLGIPRMKDSYIYKIIDIMPKAMEDLKAIMQSYTLNVSEDNLKKIMEIVAEYLPKKK
jgi:DNA-directed RNA polymerase subunit F